MGRYPGVMPALVSQASSPTATPAHPPMVPCQREGAVATAGTTHLPRTLPACQQGWHEMRCWCHQEPTPASRISPCG